MAATFARPRVAPAAAPAPSPATWLRSPRWDLTFLIGSAALIPIPLLAHHGLGVSQTAVNLLVAGLIGGPHLYSTFTYTFMEPGYRRRHGRFLAGSLALPVLVTALSFASMQILLTVFFGLWVAKCARDWRAGRLLVPSVLLIGLTIAIGFTLPLLPNTDVAFQGFNVWHSVQYLALVWFLMAMRKDRGEIYSHFVAEMNGPDRVWRFYGLAVALTAAAGVLVLVIHGAFGVPLQQAYYIVILSTLLQHYYLDHLQFTKLGDMLGSGDRLLAGRA